MDLIQPIHELREERVMHARGASIGYGRLKRRRRHGRTRWPQGIAGWFTAHGLVGFFFLLLLHPSSHTHKHTHTQFVDKTERIRFLVTSYIGSSTS